MFQHVIMPVAWLAGFAGLLSLGVLFVAYIVNGTWIREAAGIFATAACFPALLLVVRVVRGHFNSELDEP